MNTRQYKWTHREDIPYQNFTTPRWDPSAMPKESPWIKKTKVLNLFYVAPGPGNYKLPSDFGYYVSQKFYRKSKDQIKIDNTNSISD